jgi:hypothetical protein
MVHLVAIVFPDNFSFPEQEEEMVFDRPPINGSIEGNIRDSTSRVAADVLKDGAAVFIVQQFLDPAKDERDTFEESETTECSPDNAADLDPERQLKEQYFFICACGVIVTIRRWVGCDDIPGTNSSDIDGEKQKKKKYRR